MKTILAYAFASLLSLSAFAANEHHPTPPPQQPAPLILGMWNSDHPMHTNNGVLIHTSFNFTRKQMTMHATCEFRGPMAHLTVGVNSRVAYNGNLIYVYDAVDASINDGYRYCNASFRPSTWEFYFQGADMNHAVLFAPVPYQWRINVTRSVE